MYRITSCGLILYFISIYFIDKVVSPEELAIAPISRLFTTNNREQLDQNESVRPPANSTFRYPTGYPTVEPSSHVPNTAPRVALPAPMVNANAPKGVHPTHDDLHNRARAYNPEGKASMEPPKHFELYKMIPQRVELCYKAVPTATFAYACFFLV